MTTCATLRRRIEPASLEGGKRAAGRRKGVNYMSFLAAAGPSRTLENGPYAGVIGREQA